MRQVFPNIVFDTNYGSYFTCFVIIPRKNADVRKKVNIFSKFILLFYRCYVQTTLHQACFKLNRYKRNKKGKFQWFTSPQRI